MLVLKINKGLKNERQWKNEREVHMHNKCVNWKRYEWIGTGRTWGRGILIVYIYKLTTTARDEDVQDEEYGVEGWRKGGWDGMCHKQVHKGPMQGA